LKTRPAPTATATPDDATPAVVPARRNPLSPKKLLLSKWTAVQHLTRENHFVVVRLAAQPPSQSG
jgi:hypothetical protein